MLEMPIHQAESQVNRAQEHIGNLKTKYPNVHSARVELTESFESLKKAYPAGENDHLYHLSLANTRARLRMTTLFYYAGIYRLLVAGTGNKVEDFGVGFFTKYGDGGVDLSPIADLNKTEVYSLAKYLNVAASIQNAAPTDGLFGDNRTDEDQIGASYPELEWAMDYSEKNKIVDARSEEQSMQNLNERQKDVLKIYLRMNRANKHKMIPIPVCEIPKELK